MRIDQLDVVLRARSQWEAMELGTALVRRHAAAMPGILLSSGDHASAQTPFSLVPQTPESVLTNSVWLPLV